MQSRRRNIMFPICLGCLRKRSGMPTASMALCACELTNRLRFIAVLLRPDRSDAVDPVVAHTYAAIAIRRKEGAMHLLQSQTDQHSFDTQGAVRSSDNWTTLPHSDDRVLGWTLRRPRVLKHCASSHGRDCFRPERCTQPQAQPPRPGCLHEQQRHP